jgi:membrane protein implicated in regulation of membrane protease activity
MLSGRLILAFISTLLEEAALVAVALVGLPELGINIPIVGLIAIMIGWAAVAVLTYRAGSRALKRKPVTGLEAMVGSKGRAVKTLNTEGLVRIGDELWRAKSDGIEIAIGDEVNVVGQDGNELLVRPSD